MDHTTDFCSQLLKEGRVVFAGPPIAPLTPTGASREHLAQAFQAARLEVAGALIAFDAAVASEAAELVRQACWALVCRTEPAEVLAQRLAMRSQPSTPAQHLSADLMLRYLPQVLDRARATGAADPLVTILARVARQWPLSGVLADVREGPTTPLDFGGHEGLMLLYAERLARHGRPAWVPDGGRARGYAALVFHEHGRTLPPRASETPGDA